MSKKSNLLSKYKDQDIENVVATVFFGLITFSLAIIIVGGIWAIADLFSTQKFLLFTLLSLPSQIFIAGLILVIIFFLIIFLLVIYRRGKTAVLNSLFKSRPDTKKLGDQEYLPAKIIAAGALVSFCIIFFGLIIALIEFITFRPTEVIDITKLTGGTNVLIVGLIVFALSSLMLGAFYMWQNGYYLVMKNVINYNERFTTVHEFSEKQKKIGMVFFVLIVMGVVMTILGLIWALISALALDWAETFTNYPFGIKFSILGLFGTGLFALLIFAMMLFRWGNITINTALFVKKQPDVEKDNLSAKIISVGILIGIGLMVFSLIGWVISLIANTISGEITTNLFAALASLSGGLFWMSVGILISTFAVLVLVFVFAFNNGYVIVLREVIRMEGFIDGGIDSVEEKMPQNKKSNGNSDNNIEKDEKT